MRRWLPIAALAVVFVGVAASASAQTNGPNQTLHTQLTVSLSDPNGGSVAGCDNESPASCIACPDTNCAALVREGFTITLTATAKPGFTFTGWSGLGCSGTGSCTF